jgi:glutathione S-transferase
MALTLYYGSGSPYAWRVWLALEHKQIPYEFKLMSFDAGDLQKPEFLALNPRGKIPVLVDDGFALAESAAIMEYIEDRWPTNPRLFAADLRQRAIERRMVRETDDYVQAIVARGGKSILFTPPEKRSEETIAAIHGDLQKELARWESAIQGDYLSGALSAADFTLYPMIALFLRMEMRHPSFAATALLGPRLAAWVKRMEALPATKKTWPPHWQ